MHITRLRLQGFKSFVEPAELVIERGLTGVVGPNGCGKSNLLEALRWVMGETSYKSMRGSSMEDVIFSGTNARPARNIAQVTIALDNRDRKAHPAFNDEDNLEITRRIERDSGSQYHINGKPVRARDVQLLFADASTGAHSPALVQQGRIGEIVSAKPAQRRFILEEAAGITGLHSRRHEAEIKLRGAENNLERLLDIIGQMDTRLSSLKRQERQVKRYRQISREIERLTILHLYSDWLVFEQAVDEATQKHQVTLQTVGEKTKAEAQIRQLQMKAVDQLPKFREREMVTAAVVQRLNIESDHLEREQQAQQKRKDELIARHAQIDADLVREENVQREDQQRLDDFAQELSSLAQTEKEDGTAHQLASQMAQEKHTVLSDAEHELLTLNNLYAEQKAHRLALEREGSEKQNSNRALDEKRTALAEERDTIGHQLAQIADFDELNEIIERFGERLLALDKQLQTGELDIETKREQESQHLHEQMQARSQHQSTIAQIEALEKMLHSPTNGQHRPVLEEIDVTPGYETALGAALGEDLEASLNSEAELFWRGIDALHALPALPDGAIPLSQLVTAPKALAHRLHMTGIIERSQGNELQKLLAPGQRLVSVDGDLWRWDGFIAHADAPTNAARRLAGKNQLEKLRGQLEKQALQCEQTEQAATQVQEQRRALQATHQEHKEAARKVSAQLTQGRLELAKAERQASAHKGRLEAIEATNMDLNERQTLETARLEQVRAELEQLADLTKMQESVHQHTQTIGTLRTSYHEAKTHSDGLEQARRNRLARTSTLQAEINRTTERMQQGLGHVKTLQQRRQKDGDELSQLGDLPERTKTRREALNSELVKADAQRSLAADELQQGENTLREIEAALQNMQMEAAKAREQRAGCEARLDGARSRLEEQVELIHTELDCTPDKCLHKAGLEEGEALPDSTELERQHAKASADRERLGSVNLLADEEARELATQIEEMSLEHKDLIDAIDALRTAISGLNKEGRRRLMSAFSEINSHFESLFTSLFGGGKARLELIESDDPLQAGLEIIASPPGKKSQVLTLLSGGEQALTALSLIFAVFLTNPAPICVLDEVDAPLDDANVERFCTLLDEMTTKTDTRFLVITHHPATMSRMDRLFGVTMAEKGVSQMVSVDLQTAESYRETA